MAIPKKKTKAKSKRVPALSPATRKRKASSKSSWFKPGFRHWLGLSLVAIMVLTVGWLLTGGNISGISQTDRLKVATSFYPLYYFASEIGGDKAEVTSMVPAGADAHDFEPSPRDIADAYNADVFIYHHDAMEPWAARLAKDYKQTLIRTTDGIALQPGISNHDHAHSNDHRHSNHHHSQDESDGDPHIWTDPVLAEHMVEAIASGMAEADMAHANYYHERAQVLIRQLADLNRDFKQGLENCQQRTIVTSHAAFRYLAKRYNLDIVPIAGLTPEQEPSAGKLAELSNLVRHEGISTIFFEKQTNSRLATTLANEAGVTTSVLDPIESIHPQALEQGQNYLTIQRSNLENLTTALGCR